MGGCLGFRDNGSGKVGNGAKIGRLDYFYFNFGSLYEWKSIKTAPHSGFLIDVNKKSLFRVLIFHFQLIIPTFAVRKINGS